MFIYTHTHLSIYIYIHTHTYTYIHRYIYIYIYTYTSIYRGGRRPTAPLRVRERRNLGSSKMWCLRMWCLIMIVLSPSSVVNHISSFGKNILLSNTTSSNTTSFTSEEPIRAGLLAAGAEPVFMWSGADGGAPICMYVSFA